MLQTEHQVALTSLKNSYEKRITEIITSNAQAVIDMQHRISQEMSQKWENLYQEEQKKVQLLTTSLDSANEKILTLENDLQRVIYETKKKAYEKVKAQFDAGNKEFQKLKLSLKEIVNDKEKVERKVTQQEGKIGELLTEIQSLREQNENYKLQSLALQNLIKSYPLISEVTWTPSSENNLQEAVTILRNFYEMKFQVYGKLSSEWEEKNRQDKSQIMILEGNIRELNQEKMTLNEQIVKCQQEIRQRDEALEQIRQEVDGLKHERDSQLMAIATILQEKNVLDGEYQRKVLEVAELTTRCEGLRQMNEEIVCMLEKVYQEKTDNQ